MACSRSPMCSSEPLPDKVQGAVRVTLDRVGRFHVCYPVRVESMWNTADAAGAIAKLLVTTLINRSPHMKLGAA